MKALIIAVTLILISTSTVLANNCENSFTSTDLVSLNLPTTKIESLGMPKRRTVSKYMNASFKHLLNATTHEFSESGLADPLNWRSLYKGFTQGNTELVNAVSTSTEKFIASYRNKSILELQSEFKLSEIEAKKLSQMINFFEIDQPALIMFLEAYGKHLRHKNRVIAFDDNVNQLAAEGISHLDPSAIGSLALFALGAFVIIPELNPSFQEMSAEEQNLRSWIGFGVLSIGISIPMAIWSVAKVARAFVHTPLVKIGEIRQRRLARNRVKKNINETLSYLESLQRDLSQRTTTVEDLEEIISEINNLETETTVNSEVLLKRLYEFQLKMSDYISDTLHQAPHPWLSSSKIIYRVLELAKSSATSRKLSATERATLNNILSYLESHQRLVHRLKSMVDAVSTMYEKLKGNTPAEPAIPLLVDQKPAFLQIETGLENLQIISSQLDTLGELMVTKEQTLEPLLVFDSNEEI